MHRGLFLRSLLEYLLQQEGNVLHSLGQTKAVKSSTDNAEQLTFITTGIVCSCVIYRRVKE